MGVDLAAVAPGPTSATRARPAEARPDEALARRAWLNAIGSLFDYGAKAAVSLAVTPILVSGLGRSLFGVWEMLSRLGSYLSATDGRPTEALRLVIAQHQSVPDEQAKRRFVGATLAVWCLTLPIVLAGGAALSWWAAPALTRAPAALTGQVRLTCALFVLSMIVTGLGSVPESVLRGMNLGYRRMGLQAGLNVLGGGLAAAAVWGGFGLVGLGHAQVLRAAAAGLTFWMLARRYVAWFGAARASLPEIRSLFGMSVWLAAGDAVARILLSSDVVILGAVVAPAAVTSYALTGYAARTAVGMHVFAAGAAMPGLGGLLGDGQIARVTRARSELLTLSWLFASVLGAAILLWNRAFLSLWVGAENYAGVWVDLLIVLATIQTVFIRTDAWVLDATLRPRLRVTIGALAAAVAISLSIGLTRTWGIAGLCIGMLAGRGVQSVAYPMLVRRYLTSPRVGFGSVLRAARLTAVTIVLFAGCAVLGQRAATPHWAVWAGGVVLSLPLLTGLALAAGLTAAEQRDLLHRIRTLRRDGPRP